MLGTNVEVFGRNNCAIIYYGAQISLLSEDVWGNLFGKDRNDPNYFSDTITIKSLGGSSMSSEGMVSIDWKINGTSSIHRINFSLVATGVIPFCMLLGANAFETLKLCIDFDMHHLCICENGRDVRLKFALNKSARVNLQYCLSQEFISSPNYCIPSEVHINQK